MVSKLPNSILSVIPWILIFIVIATVLAFIVLATVELVKATKSKSVYRVFGVIIPILSILIAMASWFLNFGWLRFFLTFIAVPVIHAIVLFTVFFFCSRCAEKSKLMGVLLLLFDLSYLAAYLFFPDFGDVGGMYSFFGLIKNELLVNLATVVSGLALEGHIMLLVIILVLRHNLKKKQKSDSNNTQISEDTP